VPDAVKIKSLLENNKPKIFRKDIYKIILENSPINTGLLFYLCGGSRLLQKYAGVWCVPEENRIRIN